MNRQPSLLRMLRRFIGKWSGHGSGGFSLVETVVVLVLLGAVAVSVISRSSDLQAALAAETNVLRGHLRFAQGLAMANNTANWSVQFNSSSYTLLRDGKLSPINLPDESNPVRLLSEGVRIVEGTGGFTFNEWGDPGRDIRITLSDGKHQRSIFIYGFTGLIP